MAQATNLDQEISDYLAGRSISLVGDPYPLLAEIRERSRVHPHGAAVLIPRYEDVRVLCSDLERFRRTHYDEGTFAESLRARLDREDQERFAEISAFERMFLSRTHGEQHVRIRSAAHRAFTPRMVAQLETYAASLADELLETMAGGESVDLVDHISFRLPLLVIARMMGVPAEDAEMIHSWTLPMAAFLDRQDLSQVKPWHDAMREFQSYVRELVASLAGKPPETNLVASLMQAADEGQISQDELVATFVILLFAGHETTTNLISNGVYRLLTHREQWEALCDDRGLAESAVEEMLRYDPPVQFTHRIPLDDIEVGDTVIPAGTTMMLLIAAANRDPGSVADPDDFDLRRPRSRHLSFALGPVFCLGASLARMEGRVVFSSLARRYPRESLALAAEPEWVPNAQLRGPSRLLLDVGR